MSDDDLIREAVHELVAAAPAPQPLPSGWAASRRSYRWLAVAAATLLIVAGVGAIAWLRSGEDQATPVATTEATTVTTPQTTQAAPTPTTPGSTVEPSTTTPVTEPATAAPSAAPTTSSPATTAPVVSTAPATEEQAQLEAYLGALANGRYDDAALLLREGGLEYEARSDLRPLFTDYGDVDDLPARLQSWCEGIATCATPDGPPTDIGRYWVATWTTPGGTLTGFFRSGSFEGAPSVTGLPPRRPQGTVNPCPTANVEAVREADLDTDPTPETVVITRDDGPVSDTVSINVCNTGLRLTPQLADAGDAIVVGVLDPSPDVPDAILIGTSGDAATCGSTYQPDTATGTLSSSAWNGCWGNNGSSVGCRAIDGTVAIIGYTYSFGGGDRLDNSTAMDVDVGGLEVSSIDSFTLTLPDQIDEAFQIVEPHCNDLPVITYG